MPHSGEHTQVFSWNQSSAATLTQPNTGRRALAVYIALKCKTFCQEKVDTGQLRAFPEVFRMSSRFGDCSTQPQSHRSFGDKVISSTEL